MRARGGRGNVCRFVRGHRLASGQSFDGHGQRLVRSRAALPLARGHLQVVEDSATECSAVAGNHKVSLPWREANGAIREDAGNKWGQR